MSEVMCFFGGRIHWDIQFYRPVQDWEVEALAMFLDMLYSMDVRGYGANKVCWMLAMRKRFWGSRFLSLFISFFYHLFSLEKVWQSKVPPRVVFFPWTAALGKILTTDNFQNRHIVVLDWCKRCGESAEHLPLNFRIAYALWSMVFCLYGIHWVMLYKFIELLDFWQGKFERHRNIDFWKFVPHCLFWHFWREQNGRCFEDFERSILD